jgi:hypothetical protein
MGLAMLMLIVCCMCVFSLSVANVNSVLIFFLLACQSSCNTALKLDEFRLRVGVAEIETSSLLCLNR